MTLRASPELSTFVTYLGVCVEVHTQARRARRGRQTTMEAVVGEPWVGLVCEWCNVWSKSDDHLLAVFGPSRFLPPTSSSSCPRVLALLSLPTPHTHKDRLPKQGKENNKELGQALTSSSCFQTTASNGLLHELLMAAQSGFFVAKHSTSTTILCTPPPQDALRQGEGHAGPAAQPRGGERAAL